MVANIRNQFSVGLRECCFLASLFGVAWLRVFFPVLQGSKTFLSGPDTAVQTYAWLTKISAGIHVGQLSLWSFGTMGGTSFIGELQTAPLYPLALIAARLGSPGDPLWIDLFIASHFLIAGLAAHFLGRTLGLSLLPSTAGGLIFAFAGAVAERAMAQPNLYAGYVFMPAAVAFTVLSVRALQWPSTVTLALAAGLVLGLSVLAGHVHGTIHTGFVMLIAAVFTTVSLKRKLSLRVMIPVACLLVSMMVAIAVTAPQLYAASQYLSLSYKWYGPGYTRALHIVPFSEYVRLSLPIQDLVTIFGTASTSVDGGTLFLTWVGLATATLGIASIFIARTKASRTVVFGSVLCVAALAMALSGDSQLGRLFYELPVLNLIRVPSRAIHIYALGSALVAAGGVQTILDIVHRHSRSIAKSLVVGILVIMGFEATQAMRVRLASTENPYYPRQSISGNPKVTELLSMIAGNPLIYRVHFLPDQLPANLGDILPILTTTGYRSSRLVIFHDYYDWNPLSERMDDLAVRWWVSSAPVTGLQEVNRLGDLYVYERPTALPVFWLLQSDGKHVPLPIHTIKCGQNAVAVTFETPVEGAVIFAQSTYPGWRARADGVDTPVSAYAPFMKIFLAHPTQTLEVRYDPIWFQPLLTLALGVGLGAFTASVLLLALGPLPRPCCR